MSWYYHGDIQPPCARVRINACMTARVGDIDVNYVQITCYSNKCIIKCDFYLRMLAQY